MKRFKNILVFGLFILSACIKDDDETLILPEVKYFKPIEEVIPDTIQQQLEKHMDIFTGSTPPDIEGTYLVNPANLVYSSDGQFSVGHVFTDVVMKFSAQNSITNIITYTEKYGTTLATSDEVSISGSNNNFTAYFNTIGEYADNITTYKEATLISGTITSSGIKNHIYAFVMLEKNDPNNILMDVGVYRIVKDGNELASNTSWEKSAKLDSENSLKSQNSAVDIAKTESIK
jgi:hypothetical protein